MAVAKALEPSARAQPLERFERARDPLRCVRVVHPVAFGRRARGVRIVDTKHRGVPAKIILAELSGAPGWDQKLFETMRSWRYAPYVGKSALPEPVCHGVTFIYSPKRR